VPQPAPGGKADGQPLPAPRPFPADERRLPRLASPLGTTPRPTEKDLAEFRQFIDGVIDPRNTLDLIEGRSRLLVMKVTPSQTQVADQNVLSLGVLGPNQLSLIGKKPGSTVLTLFFPDPKDKTKEHVLSYLVRVLPDPEAKERLEATYKVLEKEINCAFPNSRVCLALVGDKLMVSGQAHDIQEAFQIMRIARANAPGATQDAGAQAGNQAGKVPPIPNVAPVEAAGDPTNPTGTPGLSNYQTSGGPNVINNLRIPGEQQVMLKVTVAEVNRAAARSIGVNYSVINNRGTTVFAQMTGNLGSSGLGGLGSVGSANGIIGASGTTGLGGSPGLGGVTGGAGVNLPINIDSGQLPILLNALRNLNYARSLAEPNLTAMNGQTATFLAGGQFPVPVLGGLGGFGAGGAGGLAGLQGVQFVPFGVQLAFTPIITDRDRIRLSVRATVSTRDLNTGANVGGTAVPGLSARTFSTTVELREGQTLAVAGLIQNNLGADSSRVPFLGDLPLVGNLSGVSRIQHGEQELVILITPELVHPLDAKERPALPGSDLFEPGDTEFYVLGRLESRRAYDYRSPVRTDVHRMLNYRRCEEKYIFGPTGYSAPAGK
jgi:pilus assembly protein CpaC